MRWFRRFRRRRNEDVLNDIFDRLRTEVINGNEAVRNNPNVFAALINLTPLDKDQGKE